jgi:hypothetical protein
MKATFSGLAVFLILALSGCDTPDYAPETPGGLRAEKSENGNNVRLYCSYSSNTEFIDIYCRGPGKSELEYYESEKVSHSPKFFTLDGAGLSYFGGSTGAYSFAVRARNEFGSSGMSPVATIENWTLPPPPDTPSPLTSLTLVEPVVWGSPDVYLEFLPRDETGVSYRITVDNVLRYDDYSPGVVNGIPVLAIPKSLLVPPGNHNFAIVVKNKYTGKTPSSNVIIPVTIPQKPGITLHVPKYDAGDAGYVNLPYDLIDYDPEFKVFRGTTAGFTPAEDLNRISGVYNTLAGNSTIRIPKNATLFSGEPAFVSGTVYYIVVQATGLFDTGGYSLEATLIFEPKVTLISAVSDGTNVTLNHDSIDYYSDITFTVFCGTNNPPSNPIPANQIPGTYLSTGTQIVVPQSDFPSLPGTYYIRVQATGPSGVGDYSKVISLTLP